MPRRINKSNCIGCDSFKRVCKVGCITKLEEKRIINESVCVDCGACQLICPKKCISPNQ